MLRLFRGGCNVDRLSQKEEEDRGGASIAHAAPTCESDTCHPRSSSLLLSRLELSDTQVYEP